MKTTEDMSLVSSMTEPGEFCSSLVRERGEERSKAGEVEGLPREVGTLGVKGPVRNYHCSGVSKQRYPVLKTKWLK